MKLKLVEAGDQGFNEAGEEYKKMLLGLIAKAHQEGEVKGVKETHSRSFLTAEPPSTSGAAEPRCNQR